MQANEFEKKVKLSIDELKLHPSGKVWQKVEEAIRERKRKRRIAFFLLFALIGLLLAGYGIYNYSNQKPVQGNETVSDVKPTTTEPNNDNNNSNQTIQTDKNNNNNNANNNNTTINNNTVKQDDKTVTDKLVNNSNQPKQTTPQQTNRRAARKNMDENASIDVNNAVPDKQKKKEVVKNEPVKNETEADTKNEAIAAEKTKVEKPAEEKKAEPDNNGNNLVVNNQTDSTAVAVTNNNKPEEQIKAPEKAAEKKKDLASDKKKWRWGFSFSPGVSSLSENLFSFEKSSYAMADNLNAGPSGAPSSPVSPGYNEPSSSKTGFSFKAGVTLQKDLSKRISFSTGLLYAYHSDRIRIGMMNSSTPLQNFNQTYVSPYYRGGPPKNYTDNYHFIELPMMFNWRISENQKRFLSLNMGPSVSYLFKTNALVYDPSLGGFYYHDKSMINKLHLGFNTGASFHLIDKKGKEWTLGPRFSFDTKKVFKTPYEERNYFIYAGINIGMTLPAKKSK